MTLDEEIAIVLAGLSDDALRMLHTERPLPRDMNVPKEAREIVEVLARGAAKRELERRGVKL